MNKIYNLFIYALMFSATCFAGDLEKFSNVTLVDAAYHDGDSFRVNISNRQVTVRLYFVDCPETSVSHNTDARRVRTQKRYFGLDSARDTILYGRLASEFTSEQLEKPFTLYTSFATAMGRSSGGRYYGFIQTAAGDDLGELLVANGYARAYGVSRSDWRGKNHEEEASMLNDMESFAMLGRKGIWRSANADKLVAMRAQERSEAKELSLICDALNAPLENIDINSASLADLETLPEIGVVTAKRIIAGRPYSNIEDLLELPRITEARLEKLRKYFVEI
jgi:endonuclease YncB( thermonuclease family)